MDINYNSDPISGYKVVKGGGYVDTSKKYIKMCEQAKEIQQLKFDSGNITNSYYAVNDNGDNIWLPRQDQLQGMVTYTQPAYWHAHLRVLNGFDLFCGWASCHPNDEDFRTYQEYNFEQRKYTFKFVSMEQLWLAFIMKEKYNKIWKGKIWVIDKQGGSK